MHGRLFARELGKPVDLDIYGLLKYRVMAINYA